MRASTVRCRFSDRCGDSLGVESAFKDLCILAAVLNRGADVSLGRIYEQVCAERSCVFFATGATGVTYL